jgi:hypothetical protein
MLSRHTKSEIFSHNFINIITYFVFLNYILYFFFQGETDLCKGVKNRIYKTLSKYDDVSK